MDGMSTFVVNHCGSLLEAINSSLVSSNNGLVDPNIIGRLTKNRSHITNRLWAHLKNFDRVFSKFTGIFTYIATVASSFYYSDVVCTRNSRPGTRTAVSLSVGTLISVFPMQTNNIK